jgi:hypothetical protein
MRRLVLLVLFAAPPALAEDLALLDASVAPAPGAVAQFLQAQGLAELGRQGKDPLLVLTAARLTHGFTLTDTQRQPDPAATTAPVAATALTGKALLDLARQLDAGDTYADLIDLVAREVPPPPRALRATASTLAAGASETWTLAFHGGTYAELAILGDGKSNLDLLVMGPGDTHICTDRGSADQAICGFALRENGDVTVTVSNAGTSPDTYLLLTD